MNMQVFFEDSNNYQYFGGYNQSREKNIDGKSENSL